jgi:hypothetical protein
VCGNADVYGDAIVAGTTKLSEGNHDHTTKAQVIAMFMEKL